MNKKKIKILTTGVIRVKKLFLNGPVLTPYFETIENIFSLISSGAKVIEVCDDGTEIPLTLSNFGTDNNEAKRTAREAEEKAKQEAARALEAEKLAKAKAEKEQREKEERERLEAERKEAERLAAVKKAEETKTDEVYSYDRNKNNNNQYNNKHNKHNKNKNYINNNSIKVEEPVAVIDEAKEEIIPEE